MQASPIAMLILFVFTLVAQPSVSVDQDIKAHNGIVVSVTAGKLTMSDEAGKNEHTHEVTLIATVTLNGQPARLAQLMKGDMVQVNVSPEGKVLSVEAKRAAN